MPGMGHPHFPLQPRSDAFSIETDRDSTSFVVERQVFTSLIAVFQ
jgi:hypothetical protein